MSRNFSNLIDRKSGYNLSYHAGNPYFIDPELLQQDGYGRWTHRIDDVAGLYDVIRIDHLRGFESYRPIPYGETTAQ